MRLGQERGGGASVTTLELQPAGSRSSRVNWPVVSVGFLWLRRNGGCATTDVVAADDAVLLRRVAAGDKNAALEELYRRYERRMYVFGLRLLGDRGLAEELVQECFLRLWRTADRFDACRGNVAAYLFMLARSIASDLLRRPSSRPFVPERAEVGDRATAAPDATDSMLTRLVVDQAMSSLSPQHREVLALSYDGDLTQSAIAAILGIPLGTVKTRSYFALRGLKLALAERGIHE
jgi:RNA polymerase sigma-70 factor, ECF subfamily